MEKLSKKIIYVLDKSPHPALQILYNNPPKNIKFVFKETKSLSLEEAVVNRKSTEIKTYHNLNLNRKIIYHFKNFLINFFEKIKVPIIIPVLPNRKFYYDYVWSIGLLLSYKKHISYIDYIGGIVKFNDMILNSKFSLKLIRKILLGNKCKYVFNWSESSRKMLIDVLKIPKDKQKKFITLYPIIEPKKKKIKKDNIKVRMLFVSSTNIHLKDFNFCMKGGKLTLQAFKELRKKFDNIELHYVGNVIEEYKEHYSRIEGIFFYKRMTHEKLRELYLNSDIFIFPTYGDIFGFTFIEAMSFGLPIVGINNNFAATELVIDNETGFLVDTSQKFLKFPFFKYCPEWISRRIYYQNLKKEDDIIGLKNLVEKLEILIQNKELREKFGLNGRKRITDGDLSKKNRNQLLFKLFE